MEGKEWIWDNGILEERSIARYKENISKASYNKLEEVKIKAFTDFMSKL